MLATTPRPQDTTVVALPDLALSTYRAVIAGLQAEYPAEAARIGRGLDVLLRAEIRETGELGRYLVQSCQDSGSYYLATSWACCCPDRQRHPEQRCKHNWALTVLTAASAIARRERLQARYWLTDKGLAATEPQPVA